MTVVKLNPQGKVIIQYQGEIVERSSRRIVIRANWEWPIKDLGYICFEPGDCFTEYYYNDQWFNILDVSNAKGERKGWYCNVAEPAQIFDNHVEEVDLLLDVWVNPAGDLLILDEEEFEASTLLTNEQRIGAKKGLKALLHMIETKQDMFADIPK